MDYTFLFNPSPSSSPLSSQIKLADQNSSSILESSTDLSGLSQENFQPSFVENSNTLVSLQNIGVELNQKCILNHLSLKIERDQRLALMGPSGVGKSTLLKVLAGILIPNEGKVLHQGSVSMVFDQDALYPMLSCIENIELGVDFSKISSKKRRAMAKHWIQVFDCQSFWKQKASTLSAGQRKRTGLARAMMKQPDLLLLDETFHALDESLRKQLMETILRLQTQMHFALVFSTHDPVEAEFLKAKVFILEEEN